MDPNKTLIEINLAIAAFDDESQTAEQKLSHANELVWLIIGLNNWLSAGGYLPDAWRKASGR